MSLLPKIAVVASCSTVLVVLALAGSALLRIDSSIRQLDEGLSALKTPDGFRAIELLEPLSKQGNATAQEVLAMVYAYGIGGVPKNRSLALQFYRQCLPCGYSIEGDADPMKTIALNVADSFACGHPPAAIDIPTSREWLAIAAAAGSPEAAQRLQMSNWDCSAAQ